MSNEYRSLSDQITATPEGMRVWQQERVIFEITERICELMSEMKITRTEMARRLGKEKAWITRILNGNPNMTIRTISDCYWALGRAFNPSDGELRVKQYEPTRFEREMTIALENPFAEGQTFGDDSESPWSNMPAARNLRPVDLAGVFAN